MCQLAQRLQASIRQNDFLARIAGDEFVVLLTNIKSAEEAAMVSTKIIKQVNDPFYINSHKILMTLSIGIAITPDHSKDAEVLLSYADKAIYSVKKKGKNNAQFFSHELNLLETRRLKILSELRFAADNEEFYLQYQPVFDKQNNICHCEALIRWNSPVFGKISPTDFISIAEQNGVIAKITQWVLKNVCQQIIEWQNQGVATPRVSINISSAEICDPLFVKTIKSLLAPFKLDHSLLEFEITETAIMQDVDVSVKTL